MNALKNKLKKLRKYLKFALLAAGIIFLNLSFRESIGLLLLFLSYLEHKNLLWSKSTKNG